MKFITITDETHQKLTSLKGTHMQKLGHAVTYDYVIQELLQK